MRRVSLSVLWNESFNCQQVLHSTFQVSLSHITEVSFLCRALHSLSIVLTDYIKREGNTQSCPKSTSGLFTTLSTKRVFNAADKDKARFKAGSWSWSIPN